MEQLPNLFISPGYAHVSTGNYYIKANHENKQDICKAGTVLVLFEETE